jgi:hypothetical protein
MPEENFNLSLFGDVIVDGLRQVGFDTTLFSGISARRGGLSTAIEAGVPEHTLWMQSGHRGTHRTSQRGVTSSLAAPRCCTTRGRPSTCKTPTGNPTSSALFRATRGWPFGPDPGLSPLRFQDLGRPTRAGPRRDRKVTVAMPGGGGRDQGT